MSPRRDPLRNAEPLIRRVYAYVAYRVGSGPDAEDITSDAFERALRYRDSYDPRRGEPVTWLLAIARNCIEDDRRRPRPMADSGHRNRIGSNDEFEVSVVDRLAVARAVDLLDARSRDLIALRYGADLSSRQIGEIMNLKPNAVDVALHRALDRLRSQLEDLESAPPLPITEPQQD